ncbi:MAG: phytoene desaturase family protein, partial [Cellulomonadaceae bacterium]
AAHLGLRMLGYRLGAGGARGARRDTPRDARAHDRTARAMFAGLAAHVIGPMPSLAGAGTALVLGTLAHAGGWPVAVGGSQVVADALMADLQAHGAHLRVETRVRRAGDLPPARAYVLDTSAHAAGQILGEGLGARTRAALGRVRYGDGAAKVDFVLRGPVPWAVPDVGRAATVHLGGTSAQIAHAEAEVAAGRHGEHPVVLVADPCVGDPDREVGGLRPLWTYAHVPAGSDRDMTAQVQAQIERFAPGFGDLVVSTRCVTAARMADHNANYVGGDISAGAVTAWQMLARPRLSLDPAYVGRMRTVVGGGPGATTTGVYLCSAAAAPGPGVHGMGGWHAARSLLAREFGLPTPALGPARARSGRVV